MKGYIDGINFHELEAQRYWTPPASWDQDRKKDAVRDAIFSDEYVGARKMDGAFYKFIKDEDGNMELLGRNKGVGGDYLNKFEWVPQLHHFFNELPNGTCLLGEIYIPGREGSNNVTTIMGCTVDKAIYRQTNLTGKLHYYIFDILAFDGKSIISTPVEDRIEELISCWRAYSDECVEWAEYFEGAELWEHLQMILSEGGEGIVITKKGTGYQPGKRPARQTYKVKKELQETLDVIILGANPPKREYTGKAIETWKYWQRMDNYERIYGEFYKRYSDGELIEPVTKTYWHEWAGSLIIGVRKDDKIVQIGSLSGMPEDVLANWQNYKGKVIEITGMQIHETGGIRHPRFVQWRPDLTPQDTDWYRIFGDA